MNDTKISGLSVPVRVNEYELDNHLRELEANCKLCKSSITSDIGVELIRAESGLRMIAVHRIADILDTEEARNKVSECNSYIDEMDKESARRTHIGNLLDQMERYLEELGMKVGS